MISWRVFFKHSNQSMSEHCRNWNVLEIVQSVFNEKKLTRNFYLIEEEMRLHFKVILNSGKEQELYVKWKGVILNNHRVYNRS